MIKNDKVCPNCNGHNLRPYSGAIKAYFCEDCKMGFVYPVPSNMEKYYPDDYWVSAGMFGFIRKAVYNLFQKRRKNWILNYLPRGGTILDVGAGEGKFAKSFFSSQYEVTSIDVPGAKIDNKNVILYDFLNWQTKKKFDAVVFWESLEHTYFAKSYLKKAYKLLKKGGLIFVEYPDFSCLEAKIFGSHWYHLDYPRHLTHTTKFGMLSIFKQLGFKKLGETGVYALEYTFPGIVESLLHKKPSLLLFFITCALLFLPVVLIATVFYRLNQSPIRLIIGKKIK